MVTSLRMRISNLGTLDPESCLWPTPDLTPTGHNFLFALLKHLGLMENMLFSDKSLKAWMLSRRLNPMDPNQENVRKKLLLPILANYKKEMKKKKKICERKGKNKQKQNQFIQKKPHTIFDFGLIVYY